MQRESLSLSPINVCCPLRPGLCSRAVFKEGLLRQDGLQQLECENDGSVVVVPLKVCKVSTIDSKSVWKQVHSTV